MSTTRKTSFRISTFLLVAISTPIAQAFVLPQLNVLSSPLLAATTADDVIKNAGDSALSSVEWFGSLVSKNANQVTDRATVEEKKQKANIDGTGGSVMSRLSSTIDAKEKKESQVWAALANLEKDSTFVAERSLH